ncbi:SDR family NAD(P)-dependent oxidoreductase [Sphingobium sp. TomTYG45]
MPEALITGASSGIGSVYADRLAQRGFDVFLLGRCAERLEEVRSRISRKHDVAVKSLTADLNSEDGIHAAQEVLRRRNLRLFVNNAGVGARGPLLAEDARQIEVMLATNVLAFTRLGVASARLFAKRGGGTIVNMASTLALYPEAGNAVYAATKAYVLAFSQSLRAECSAEGLQVQAVLPGATRTPIYAASGRDISTRNAAQLMDVEDLVDAALAGLDQGEQVTIPSLPDIGDWQAYEEARTRLRPHLSACVPARRYIDPAA